MERGRQPLNLRIYLWSLQQRCHTKNINSCNTEGTFPNDFKKVVVHPIHKKAKLKNLTIDQLAFCQISLKCI